MGMQRRALDDFITLSNMDLSPHLVMRGVDRAAQCCLSLGELGEARRFAEKNLKRAGKSKERWLVC